MADFPKKSSSAGRRGRCGRCGWCGRCCRCGRSGEQPGGLAAGPAPLRRGQRGRRGRHGRRMRVRSEQPDRRTAEPLGLRPCPPARCRPVSALCLCRPELWAWASWPDPMHLKLVATSRQLSSARCSLSPVQCSDHGAGPWQRPRAPADPAATAAAPGPGRPGRDGCSVPHARVPRMDRGPRRGPRPGCSVPRARVPRWSEARVAGLGQAGPGRAGRAGPGHGPPPSTRGTSAFDRWTLRVARTLSTPSSPSLASPAHTRPHSHEFRQAPGAITAAGGSRRQTHTRQVGTSSALRRGSGKGAERECDISLNRTEKVESNSANRCELIVGDL